MSYQALYRVWRPQTFRDVIGQEHITKTLQNALLKEKSSHAYLFTGPRGTGKTSAAKIIAKAVNCENAPISEPCNECAACRGITDGTISDVIEIDAASNNGVDEIRDIRDKVKYAPSAVRYKVYIIDEVHMLTPGAFNALLKTLEEPPAHVLFILATTEPHKIPLTIISRCQRFDFRPVANSAMVAQLQRITAVNEVEADEEALRLVAQAAEGGMRDALSLLDQVLSYSDGSVSTEDVLAVTGSVSRAFLAELTKAVAQKDAGRGIQSVGSLIEQGKDPMRFLEDLIYYYRDLLLYQTSSELESVLERAEVDDHFRQLADTMEKSDIYRVIETLNASQQEMKWTNHPRIFLELAVVKLCQEKPQTITAQPDEALLQRIEKIESELKTLRTRGTEPREDAPAPTDKRGTKSPSRHTVKVDIPRIKRLLDEATKHDLQQLKAKWADAMETLRKQKISAHACLIESQPVACSQQAFLMAFKHDIHCRMINENNNREAVELVIEEVFGRHMDMLAVPMTDWEKVKTAYIQQQRGEAAETDEGGEEDPLIAEARKLFASELIEMKK